MQTITKQQDATLYGNSYLLQDCTNFLLWRITGQNDFGVFEVQHGNIKEVFLWATCGSHYKILARPLDLTKEITHKGVTFVPIVELAKINSYYGIKEITTFFENDNAWCIRYIDNKMISRQFEVYNENGNLYFMYWVNNEKSLNDSTRVIMQDALFDKLPEWNFAVNLPDGSWIPVTEQNNPYK